jgi:hypothetical protein
MLVVGENVGMNALQGVIGENSGINRAEIIIRVWGTR